MSLPALATVDDLEARMGAPVADSTQALSMLLYASTLVRAHSDRLWVDEVGDLIDVPDGARVVVVEMVARASNNPDGATQQSAGEYQVSFGADAPQRIYLTKSDKQILSGAGGPSQAFTIDPTPEAAATHPLAGAWVNGPCGMAPGESDWL